ncbi:MAG: hypothetical protein ACLPX9_09095 [Rhodomicrobium sp.]
MFRPAARVSLLLAGLIVAAHQEAAAQITPNLPSLSLKSGETVEVMDLWFSVNCKSQLKSTPIAEIMEGPSEVTVDVKEAMVVPRQQNCSKPVKGAKLFVSAKDIADYSTSKLTIRITYDTKDGERKLSQSYNVALFPKD